MAEKSSSIPSRDHLGSQAVLTQFQCGAHYMPSSLEPLLLPWPLGQVMLLCYKVDLSPNHSETQFHFPTCLGPGSCFLSEDSSCPLGEARNDHLSLQWHGLVATGLTWMTVTMVMAVTTAPI